MFVSHAKMFHSESDAIDREWESGRAAMFQYANVSLPACAISVEFSSTLSRVPHLSHRLTALEGNVCCYIPLSAACMFRCNGAPKHQTIVFLVSLPTPCYTHTHTHTNHSHLLALHTATNIHKKTACCTVQLYLMFLFIIITIVCVYYA